MTDIKNIKLNGTNLSLEEKEIKKIRYNGEEYTIGGGSSTPIDNGPIYEGKYRVRYFDTDGTILKIEYVESGGKTTPPNNPTYDPDYLIFAEWNYDTENYIVEQPTDIGAIYDTVGDATYMFCRFTTKTGLNPTLAISGATSIDWGDGTVDTNLSHTYNTDGEYIIKIYGDISFNTSTSSYLLGGASLNRGLKKCYIKNGVTSISATFYNTFSLEIVTIPNSVEQIVGGAFYYCYCFKTVIIPNGITSLGDNAFLNCYGLENISIPNSVTSINKFAFGYCYGLKSVIVPNGVTSIGEQALANCHGLTNYFIDCDTVPTLSNTNAFNGINSSTIFWVKDSIFAELQVATNWSQYFTYMKPRSWYPSLTDPNA